jgi:hypothetical protein
VLVRVASCLTEPLGGRVLASLALGLLFERPESIPSLAI